MRSEEEIRGLVAFYDKVLASNDMSPEVRSVTGVARGELLWVLGEGD